MRLRRRSLTASEQSKATLRVWKQLVKSQWLLRHRHIALYFGNDGELDPSPLLGEFSRQEKHCYLPVLHSFNAHRMEFFRYHADKALQINRFGILEPNPLRSNNIKPAFLSLVLMPLVAFDENGNRLGMGGGFYDRALSPGRMHNTGPKLVGVAHEFQKVSSLPKDKWDIPLHAVITPERIYRFG